jgi:hypothetical protein
VKKRVELRSDFSKASKKPHCPCPQLPPQSTHARPCFSADVNGIEAFAFGVEVNSGWGDTVVVMITAISPILCAKRLQAMHYSVKAILAEG